MNKMELEERLSYFRDAFDQLASQIDDGDHEKAREAYSNMKTELENIVLPLRVFSRLEKSPHLVQTFLYPALNDALMELAFPKGSKINIQLEQAIYSASAQINYYIHQLPSLKA